MKIQSPTNPTATPSTTSTSSQATSKAVPETRKNEAKQTTNASDIFDQAHAQSAPATLSAERKSTKPTTPTPPTPTPSAGKMSIKDIPAANWTCFVNLNADNSLESFGKLDLNEMEAGAGGLQGKMNVIALVDGGKAADANGWTNGTRLMYVTPDPTNSKKIVSREIDVDPSSDLGKLLTAGKGELDTGSPQVLKAALAYVQQNTKSDHYMVDLWDHGNDWRGISYDDHPSDNLDMQGLKQALSDLPQKIDILSADACLMSTVEVADTAKAAGAKYLVGSEEVEPGSGWDYKDFFNRASQLFANAKDVSADQMANAITSSYGAGPTDNVTMATTDLSKLDGLNASLDTFSDALLKAGGLQDKTLRSAYTGALRFDDADQMDVGDFAKRVAAGTQNTALKTAANQLIAALAQSSTETEAKGGAAKYGAAKGLTIYAPTGAVDSEYKQKGADWLKSRWNDVIATYSGSPRVA